MAIDINNINVNIDFNDRKTQIMTAIIVAGLVIVGLIVYLRIMPRMENLNHLQERSAQLSGELERILRLRVQLENMRTDLAYLEENADSLLALFPQDADVPWLITNISRIARNLRINVMSFRPTEVVYRDFFVENQYELSLLGSYHNIGRFFAQIANLPTTINIDRVNLRASSVLMNDLQNFDNYTGSQSSDDMIRSVLVNFRLTTFTSEQGAQ